MKVSTTSARLKQLMLERNLKQADILRLVTPIAERYNMKMNKSDISQYVNGKVEPNQDKIAILSIALGISPSWLMGFNDDEQSLPINAIPYTPMARIPIIGSVRAGAGGLAMEEPSGHEFADVRNPEEYFFLRVVGDSMTPDINEGDLALIHKQPDVESGELAVAVIDGEEGTIKRVVKKPGSLILQAFNPAHQPRIFIGEEMNEVCIAGKVVRTVRIW